MMGIQKGYDFSGIYVPIITPFNDDESIAWDKLESNIKKMNNSKVKGYVVQGSTGEFCYLSSEEKIETVKKVVICFFVISRYLFLVLNQRCFSQTTIFAFVSGKRVCIER